MVQKMFNMNSYELPAPIKIEYEENCLGSDQESDVCRMINRTDSWDQEICKKLAKFIVCQNGKFFNHAVEDYLRLLKYQVACITDKQNLIDKIINHLKLFNLFYQERQECSIEKSNYLEIMENIMIVFCNLQLDVVREMRKRGCDKFQYIKTIKLIAQRICTFLSTSLLHNLKHILHVLLKCTKRDVEPPSYKDVISAIYSHFLIQYPLDDHSSESFCRNFLLFERWKELTAVENHKYMEQTMYYRCRKTPKSVKNDSVINSILTPVPVDSVSGIVTNLLQGKNAAIKSYFEHIKKEKTKVIAEEPISLNNLSFSDLEDDLNSVNDETDGGCSRYFKEIVREFESIKSQGFSFFDDKNPSEKNENEDNFFENLRAASEDDDIQVLENECDIIVIDDDNDDLASRKDREANNVWVISDSDSECEMIYREPLTKNHNRKKKTSKTMNTPIDSSSSITSSLTESTNDVLEDDDIEIIINGDDLITNGPRNTKKSPMVNQKSTTSTRKPEKNIHDVLESLKIVIDPKLTNEDEDTIDCNEKKNNNRHCECCCLRNKVNNSSTSSSSSLLTTVECKKTTTINDDVDEDLHGHTYSLGLITPPSDQPIERNSSPTCDNVYAGIPASPPPSFDASDVSIHEEDDHVEKSDNSRVSFLPNNEKSFEEIRPLQTTENNENSHFEQDQTLQITEKSEKPLVSFPLNNEKSFKEIRPLQTTENNENPRFEQDKTLQITEKSEKSRVSFPQNNEKSFEEIRPLQTTEKSDILQFSCDQNPGESLGEVQPLQITEENENCPFSSLQNKDERLKQIRPLQATEENENSQFSSLQDGGENFEEIQPLQASEEEENPQISSLQDERNDDDNLEQIQSVRINDISKELTPGVHTCVKLDQKTKESPNFVDDITRKETTENLSSVIEKDRNTFTNFSLTERNVEIIDKMAPDVTDDGFTEETPDKMAPDVIDDGFTEETPSFSKNTADPITECLPIERNEEILQGESSNSMEDTTVMQTTDITRTEYSLVEKTQGLSISCHPSEIFNGKTQEINTTISKFAEKTSPEDNIPTERETLEPLVVESSKDTTEIGLLTQENLEKETEDTSNHKIVQSDGNLEETVTKTPNNQEETTKSNITSEFPEDLIVFNNKPIPSSTNESESLAVTNFPNYSHFVIIENGGGCEENNREVPAFVANNVYLDENGQTCVVEGGAEQGESIQAIIIDDVLYHCESSTLTIEEFNQLQLENTEANPTTLSIEEQKTAEEQKKIEKEKNNIMFTSSESIKLTDFNKFESTINTQYSNLIPENEEFWENEFSGPITKLNCVSSNTNFGSYDDEETVVEKPVKKDSILIHLDKSKIPQSILDMVEEKKAKKNAEEQQQPKTPALISVKSPKSLLKRKRDSSSPLNNSNSNKRVKINSVGTKFTFNEENNTVLEEQFCPTDLKPWKKRKSKNNFTITNSSSAAAAAAAEEEAVVVDQYDLNLKNLVSLRKKQMAYNCIIKYYGKRRKVYDPQLFEMYPEVQLPYFTDSELLQHWNSLVYKEKLYNYLIKQYQKQNAMTKQSCIKERVFFDKASENPHQQRATTAATTTSYKNTGLRQPRRTSMGINRLIGNVTERPSSTKRGRKTAYVVDRTPPLASTEPPKRNRRNKEGSVISNEIIERVRSSPKGRKKNKRGSEKLQEEIVEETLVSDYFGGEKYDEILKTDDVSNRQNAEEDDPNVESSEGKTVTCTQLNSNGLKNRRKKSFSASESADISPGSCNLGGKQKRKRKEKELVVNESRRGSLRIKKNNLKNLTDGPTRQYCDSGGGDDDNVYYNKPFRPDIAKFFKSSS